MSRKAQILALVACVWLLGWTPATYWVAVADPMYTATIVNAGPAGEQTLRLDADGDHIDAHDGDLLAAPDGSFWWYGTSYGCGFQLLVASAWCGVKAYQSSDLMQWHDQGFMIPADATWHARCDYPPHYGCFNTHVIYRSASNDYLMWINTFDGLSGYRRLAAPAPGGPWADIGGEPSLSHTGISGGNAGLDLLVDDDATGYIAYVDAAHNHTLVVERLVADYTSGTGEAVEVTTGADAPALFRRGTTYYLIYSPTCEYCGGATYVRTAASPLGPWSTPSTLNTTGCGGQVSWTATVNGQQLLALDQWVPGAPNQALARYFWTTLSFVGATVAPFTCAQWITPTLTGTQTWQPPPAGLDQSAGDYGWRTWCDISAAFTRLQTFVPARNGILTSAGVVSYRGAIAPNAPLQIDIQRVSASLVPVGPVLATGSFATVGWAPTLQRFTPNVAVRAGVRYALVLRTSSTIGCYGIAYSDLGPYANGAAGYKGAGAWTSEAPRSLSFVTEVS